MKKKNRIRIKNLIKYIISFGVIITLTLIVLYFPDIYYQEIDKNEMKDVTAETFNYVDGFKRDATTEEVLKMMAHNQYSKISTSEYTEKTARDIVSKAIIGFSESFYDDISIYQFFSKILMHIDNVQVYSAVSYYAMEIVDGTICTSNIVMIMLSYNDEEVLGMIIDTKTSMLYGVYCESPHYAFWDIYPYDLENIFYRYLQVDIDKLSGKTNLGYNEIKINVMLSQSTAEVNWVMLP